MRPGTLWRLSLAGNRTDRLRTVLTAVSAALAALALLAASTVASITGGNWVDQPNGQRELSPGADYSSALLQEAGLRPGVIFALVALALPVLALAGQCIRLGAPARDRRLAALRLGGATPGQAVLIAGAETAVASLFGSLVGLVIYLGLREVLDFRNDRGQLALPVDVLPGPVLLPLSLLLVPLLAGGIGVLLMRRVVITPLGVVRRVREQGPRPWPGLVLAAGLALFVGPAHLPAEIRIFSWKIVVPDWLPLFSMGVAVLLVMAGVVLGTGWISYTAGRLLRRFGRGPATLLAGGRLMADPWNGSRTLGALLGAVVVGAGTLGFRAELETDFRASEQYNAMLAQGGDGAGFATDAEFYLGAIRLVMVAVSLSVAVAAAGMLVAFVEGIVARRRAYAALTATGVPRRTLTAVLLWHTFVPLVPALLLALSAGASLFRMGATEIRHGGPFEQCVDPTAQDWTTCVKETVSQPLLVVPIPIPLQQLALLGGGALLALLLVVGVGALVLRSSTDLEELRVG